MKYLLMMNATPGERDWNIFSWPPKDIEAHVAYWRDLNRRLREAGELVLVEALTAPKEAKLVRSSSDGLPITDGVFPETKEFLAGFWLVDVDTPARAYEIAATASRAPGPGGAPLFLQIEVRQMMGSPTPDV
jgi:hypothetical protein